MASTRMCTAMATAAPVATTAAPSVRFCVGARAAAALRPSTHLAAGLRGSELALSASSSKRTVKASAARLHVCAATSEELDKFKLISSVEIPSFIMRDDFVDQLYRWSITAGEDHDGKSAGMPFKSEPYYIEGEEGHDVLWGFVTSFVKDGDVTCEMFCGFDDESAKKYRWINRSMETGMPEVSSEHFQEVAGKNFEIWKINDKKVDDDTKRSIKIFCQELADAINRYYSFGSCWAEDL